MTRKNTAKAKARITYSTRFRFEVPEEGLGYRHDEMRAWLDRRVGNAMYEWHGDSQPGGAHAISIYLNDVKAALEFQEAFDLVPARVG